MLPNLIELAHRCSDLFTAPSNSHLAENNYSTQLDHHRCWANWLAARMSGVKATPFGYSGPQNPRIHICYCDGCFLPARLFSQLIGGMTTPSLDPNDIGPGRNTLSEN
jgi:hypothetical protein